MRVPEVSAVHHQHRRSFHARQIMDLLAAGRYQQAVDLLHRAQIDSHDLHQLKIVDILAVAEQLCQVSEHLDQEIRWYHQASEEMGYRKTALDECLSELLDSLDYALSHEASPDTQAPPARLAEPRQPGSRTADEGVPWWRFFERRPREVVPAQPVIPVPAGVVTPALPVDDHRAAIRLSAYCLGTFQVYCNDELVESWPGRKGNLILKYLLLNREQPVRKEILMELFWSDSDEEAQRNNLNVAIYGLRQALRNGGEPFSYVLFRNDCYILNPDMDVWLDYEAFMTCYQAGRRHQQAGNEQAAIHEYQIAEALYQGNLLPEDCYEEWLEPFRHNLHNAFLTLLDEMGAYHLNRSDYAACITACDRTLALDAACEESHTRLMRCYSRQGLAHLALRQYDRCVRALAAELDVQPSAETRMLYDLIRSGQMA